MNARRLATRDNWPPISWVDWPQNVGQLAAGLIVLMKSERKFNHACSDDKY